ncbi:MAG: family 78 glycoside hydrolase catalytic domain, partial [Clostridia bacterium]|nr:family 78 glycoside hydrolase catalytic domain [Clostridia bacterium]
MEFPNSFFAATKDYNTYEKHVPAPYIRRTFSVGDVTKAEVLVSGLGFYDLFLNGKRITKGLLAPYISNPDDIVYFDRYDVTQLLTSGKNAIGLILGNGMQNCPGGAVWDFDTARFRGVPRFALRLTATLKNGGTFTLDADESFRTAPSAILFDDLRSGVFYDARREAPGWCTPDFDDSGWQNVYRTEMPRGEFRLCEADPIVVTDEIAPVSIRRALLCEIFNPRDCMKLDTEYKFDDLQSTPGMLYDFGVNAAGILRLRIRGEAGQRVYIQMCEFVNSKDEPSCQNIHFYPKGYAQTEMYFLKGEGEEVFEAPFTYHGFRYALVYGLTPEQAVPETLTMLVANSDLRERGGFRCSDETMNRLGEMARRSDLANFYYFPTDCPHREKNGWTGDA